MLAKFENGNLLEVLIETEKGDELYCYAVWDENGNIIDSGWTEYVELHPSSVNWIDYILDVCKPDGASGKYELLDFKDIDEYFDSLKEDPSGKWTLERQGDEEDVRRYSTFEAAQHVMKKEYKEIYGNDDSYHMENELEDDYAIIGDEEFYQSWRIYEEESFDNPIKQKFYEIQMELDRTDVGISQYAFELMSTDVIRGHLYKAERLIDELRVMIS